MTHDVFICHSSKDRTIANAICSTLEQHHIRCWIAPRDVLPGSDYGGAIIEAISGSRLTVLVFSSNSNESGHVRREIERTISHGIPVLPFRVEEITPSPALEYFISDAHWLDAMTPPLEQHLDHLVGTVRLLLEREAAAAASDAQPSARGATEAVEAPEPRLVEPAERATAVPTASIGDASAPPPAVAIPSPTPMVTRGGRRPSTLVLGALGAAAVIVLAGGAVVLTAGGRPAASQTALASTSAAPSAAPSGSHAATASPTGSLAPTTVPASGAPGAATARLAAALPASLSCDAPEAASAGSVELASAFCYVGDGTIGYATYTLYPDLAALRRDYASWLDYYGVASDTAGSCAKGERMEAPWSFEASPAVTQGRYFCVVDDTKEANLYWSDEASLILVDLSGDTGAGLAKLYPVWQTNAYDPVRP